MKKTIYFLAIMLLILSCQTKKKTDAVQVEQQPVNYLKESKEAFNERMEWWRKARFGMFIHWGVYSVPAGIYKDKQVNGIGEWIMQNGQIPVKEYEAFAKQFNPEKFNADAWAKTMKEAGMKYVVITSKHHDGFGLWDSKVSNYDIVDFAPYGKDILKALSEACKKYDIKFGLYHSIMDWHHEDAQKYSYLKDDPNKRENNSENFSNYLENYMKPQIKELIDNYAPSIMWFDGEWVEEFTHDQGKELYQYVRSLKPDILINNRVDKGRQGMQGMNKKDSDYAGDFGTPEQEILETAADTDWESCMTMNDTWGYKKNDHNWKSTEVLIHNLIDVTAKGGNYLLNVGPTSEGIIPEPSVQRLKNMGTWLKTNGMAIYKTERLQKNYKQGDHIRFTKKKGSHDFYAMTLKKPEATFTLKNLKPKAGSSIYLIGNETKLQWEFVEDEGIKITIPKILLNTWNENSFAWTFHIQGEEI
ncbi:alpha-L-fucosidase [Flavivirga spongiicola]|uniref:alpha-L-fucosidase n=1 Tax=Flavivirga spongiicola TaxID=421621 RepID=A0ABU7XPI2_9FLAO|nr:alpha-L-fucosidase [Flavivirga sp. MEBiC05379]MDO5977475.1 alpha-L-fucosidase [Flavivirga sp. MEBiC05379]